MKRFIALLMALVMTMSLAGTAWGVEGSVGKLPVASVEPYTPTEEIKWGNYVQWSPTPGLEANLEAIYKFACTETEEEAKGSLYADWYCDFYVKLNQKLGENQIFLGGNYGDFGWVGFHNGDITPDANEEIPLLGGVTSNPWTYEMVATNVGEFICGVGDVNNALAGATFTVMLRLTNPEDASEFYNVATIEHTFTYAAEVGGEKFTTLQAAVDAAETGDTVTLLDDVDITSPIEIGAGKDVIIEGDGYTIEGSTDIFKITGGGKLTLGAGLNVHSVTDCAVLFPYPSNGTLISSANLSASGIYATIQGNGTTPHEGTKIEIKGGSVTSNTSAIYHPQDGSVTISDGVISGYSGIAMKSGSLTITGGSIRGTGDYVEAPASATDCINTDGSAICIDSNGAYAGKMTIEICGNAVLSSANGHIIREIGDGKTNDITSITVTGGTFTAASGKEVINLQESTPAATASISGGYFSSSPADYCADGYVAVTSDNNDYSYMVVKKSADAADVVVAAPDVSYSGEDEEQENIANALEVELDTDALAAKAADIANNTSAVVEDKHVDQLESELGTNGIPAEVDKEDVSIVVQTFFAVEFKGALDADDEENPYGNCFVLDITPKCCVVATTASNPEDIKLSGEGKNAVEIESNHTSEDMKITEPVVMTIAIPDAMGLDEGDTVYIIHEAEGKDGFLVEYVYEATVQSDANGLYITFTNPHGFSTFIISAEDATVAVVDGVKYADLASAITNVDDGGIIALVKNSELAALVDEPINFTVKLAGATTQPKFVLADGLKMTTEAIEGGVKYTFTKVTSGGYVPSYTPAPEVNIDVDNGSLNDAAQAVGGAVSGGSAELKPVSGYTEAEIAKLQKEGKLNLAIVKKSGYTSAAEKDLIDAAITKAGGAVSGVAVMYFDITPVLRTDDGVTVATLTDTEKAISVTLDLSAAMQKAAKDGKAIYVVRAHDGKAEFLSTKLSADKTKATFSSADFSTFAVVALDKTTSAQTFDAGILLYAGMAVAAATGSAVVIGKKRRAE